MHRDDQSSQAKDTSTEGNNTSKNKRNHSVTHDQISDVTYQVNYKNSNIQYEEKNSQHQLDDDESLAHVPYTVDNENKSYDKPASQLTHIELTKSNMRKASMNNYSMDSQSLSKVSQGHTLQSQMKIQESLSLSESVSKISEPQIIIRGVSGKHNDTHEKEQQEQSIQTSNNKQQQQLQQQTLHIEDYCNKSITSQTHKDHAIVDVQQQQNDKSSNMMETNSYYMSNISKFKESSKYKDRQNQVYTESLRGGKPLDEEDQFKYSEDEDQSEQNVKEGQAQIINKSQDKDEKSIASHQQQNKFSLQSQDIKQDKDDQNTIKNFSVSKSSEKKSEIDAITHNKSERYQRANNNQNQFAADDQTERLQIPLNEHISANLSQSDNKTSLNKSLSPRNNSQHQQSDQQTDQAQRSQKQRKSAQQSIKDEQTNSNRSRSPVSSQVQSQSYHQTERFQVSHKQQKSPRQSQNEEQTVRNKSQSSKSRKNETHIDDKTERKYIQPSQISNHQNDQNSIKTAQDQSKPQALLYTQHLSSQHGSQNTHQLSLTKPPLYYHHQHQQQHDDQSDLTHPIYNQTYHQNYPSEHSKVTSHMNTNHSQRLKMLYDNNDTETTRSQVQGKMLGKVGEQEVHDEKSEQSKEQRYKHGRLVKNQDKSEASQQSESVQNSKRIQNQHKYQDQASQQSQKTDLQAIYKPQASPRALSSQANSTQHQHNQHKQVEVEYHQDEKTSHQASSRRSKQYLRVDNGEGDEGTNEQVSQRSKNQKQVEISKFQNETPSHHTQQDQMQQKLIKTEKLKEQQQSAKTSVRNAQRTNVQDQAPNVRSSHNQQEDQHFADNETQRHKQFKAQSPSHQDSHPSKVTSHHPLASSKIPILSPTQLPQASHIQQPQPSHKPLPKPIIQQTKAPIKSSKVVKQAQKHEMLLFQDEETIEEVKVSELQSKLSKYEEKRRIINYSERHPPKQTNLLTRGISPYQQFLHPAANINTTNVVLNIKINADAQQPSVKQSSHRSMSNSSRRSDSRHESNGQGDTSDEINQLREQQIPEEDTVGEALVNNDEIYESRDKLTVMVEKHHAKHPIPPEYDIFKHDLKHSAPPDDDVQQRSDSQVSLKSHQPEDMYDDEVDINKKNTSSPDERQMQETGSEVQLKQGGTVNIIINGRLQPKKIKKLKYQFINAKKKQQSPKRNQQFSQKELEKMVPTQETHTRNHVKAHRSQGKPKKYLNLITQAQAIQSGRGYHKNKSLNHSPKRGSQISQVQQPHPKSPVNPDTDFRRKVLAQITANRQKFYTDFFLHNKQKTLESGGYLSTGSADTDRSHQRSDQLKKKAQKLYSKYELKYSGIGKRDIMHSPISQIDEKIQKNLRRKGKKFMTAEGAAQRNMQSPKFESRYPSNMLIESNPMILAESSMSARKPAFSKDILIQRHQTPMHHQQQHYNSSERKNAESMFSTFSKMHQYKRELPLFHTAGEVRRNKTFKQGDNSAMSAKTKPSFGNTADQHQLSWVLDNSSGLDRPMSNMQKQEKKEQQKKKGRNQQKLSALNITEQVRKISEQNAQNFKRSRQLDTFRPMKNPMIQNLISPGLKPTSSTITEHLLNRSVRGRPIKHLLNLVKGDSGAKRPTQISPRRDELFNQTFQEFKSNKGYMAAFALDPPEFKTDERYYYNRKGSSPYHQQQQHLTADEREMQKELRKFRQPQTNIKDQHQQQHQQYYIDRKKYSVDWAVCELYAQTKMFSNTNDTQVFNREKNLKYFTMEEAENMLQVIQERQNDYDSQDILKPILNKALNTLERILIPMGLQERFEKVYTQYQSKHLGIETILSILIRIKLSIQARKAVAQCLTQIRRFEGLLRELKDLFNQSLDVSVDNNTVSNQNMRQIVIDFFDYAQVVTQSIQELKTKHNLYHKAFVFKRKDYLRYIEKEIEEVRQMIQVFDITIPPHV